MEKENNLNCGGLIDCSIEREAMLSKNKSLKKVRFLPGAKTEDLTFHLILYLNEKQIMLLYTLGQMMDLTTTKTSCTWK